MPSQDRVVFQCAKCLRKFRIPASAARTVGRFCPDCKPENETPNANISDAIAISKHIENERPWLRAASITAVICGIVVVSVAAFYGSHNVNVVTESNATKPPTGMVPENPVPAAAITTELVNLQARVDQLRPLAMESLGRRFSTAMNTWMTLGEIDTRVTFDDVSAESPILRVRKSDIYALLFADDVSIRGMTLFIAANSFSDSDQRASEQLNVVRNVVLSAAVQLNTDHQLSASLESLRATLDIDAMILSLANSKPWKANTAGLTFSGSMIGETFLVGVSLSDDGDE